MRVRRFCDTYPGVKPAASEQEILQDPEVRLIASAAVPSKRGGLGVKVMEHGKVGFPFFGELNLDSLNRTERAMTQEHAFKAAESVSWPKSKRFACSDSPSTMNIIPRRDKHGGAGCDDPHVSDL